METAHMIKVGIVGISGYSGELLLKLLLKHPKARVTYVSANNTKGKVDDILPSLRGKTNLFCDNSTEKTPYPWLILFF